MSVHDVLFVVAPSCFRDEEYTHTRLEVEKVSCNIHVASLEPGVCEGRFGVTVYADLGLEEAMERAWGAVIFVGGGGAEVFFDDGRAHGIARDVYRSGGVCAAICIGPTILARAGLLESVVATSFPSEEAELRAHGVDWTGRPVEEYTVEGTSGWIVTGNGPDAAHAFGKAIADRLEDGDAGSAQ